MQLNYYFLRRLVPELETVLLRATFIEAFSQEKDELILCFATAVKEDFYIRATLTSSFSCLSFPKDFKRSRRNSVNQFSPLEGRKVSHLKMFLNERAFAIEFDNWSLLFKMHGNRANLVLFENNEIVSLFKNQLKADFNLDLEQMDRPIERSLDLFEANPDYKAFYPTFGKLPAQYLEKLGYVTFDTAGKWEVLQKLVDQMSNGAFVIDGQNGRPVLTLLETTGDATTTHSAIEVSNLFFRAYTGTYYFEREKQQALNDLAKRISQTENYINKSESRLKKLTEETQPQQIADILMANLHQVTTRQKSVTLFNFYDNSEIRIKLNPELSAQKNAENYYRKSKNRKIEVDKTEQAIFNKYEQLERFKQLETDIEDVQGFKALRQLIKTEGLERSTGNQKQESVPYKSFEVQSYQVWVGKNAKANDELTLKYAYKEDSWLHAKDVPGSHVLIKHKAGKQIPKLVTERAAELAAWYSKRKTDSLVPVIVTQAKYVRKRKGSPAGQVVVTKEEVIMVPSRGPSND